MEEQIEIFINSLLTGTENIEEKYFQLPVTYREFIYRERGYCYELYHQIRSILPPDYSYTLSGEIHKIGHPLISPTCGNIIPDFLVHNPGRMGDEDNLIIVEVKSIEGAILGNPDKGLEKDFNTLNCMTSIENGYSLGVILIYGYEDQDKKARITQFYQDNYNPNLRIYFHENPMIRAIELELN